MQHPFAGVLKSDQELTDNTVKPIDPTTSRRGLLAVMTGLVAVGVFGVLSMPKAHAQPATTLAVGEEGGQRPTTYAVGEEGGRPPVRVRG